jgi:hypothetical protein
MLDGVYRDMGGGPFGVGGATKALCTEICMMWYGHSLGMVACAIMIWASTASNSNLTDGMSAQTNLGRHIHSSESRLHEPTTRGGITLILYNNIACNPLLITNLFLKIAYDCVLMIMIIHSIRPTRHSVSPPNRKVRGVVDGQVNNKRQADTSTTALMLGISSPLSLPPPSHLVPN